MVNSHALAIGRLDPAFAIVALSSRVSSKLAPSGSSRGVQFAKHHRQRRGWFSRHQPPPASRSSGQSGPPIGEVTLGARQVNVGAAGVRPSGSPRRPRPASGSAMAWSRFSRLTGMISARRSTGCRLASAFGCRLCPLNGSFRACSRLRRIRKHHLVNAWPWLTSSPFRGNRRAFDQPVTWGRDLRPPEPRRAAARNSRCVLSNSRLAARTMTSNGCRSRPPSTAGLGWRRLARIAPQANHCANQARAIKALNC